MVAAMGCWGNGCGCSIGFEWPKNRLKNNMQYQPSLNKMWLYKSSIIRHFDCARFDKC